MSKKLLNLYPYNNEIILKTIDKTQKICYNNIVRLTRYQSGGDVYISDHVAKDTWRWRATKKSITKGRGHYCGNVSPF